MKAEKVIASALIAVGLFASGLCIRSGFAKVAARNRTVDVRGLCEKEVMADKVTWPIVCNYVGNDLLDVYSQIEAGNKAVKAFLTENGLDEKDISFNAPNVSDNSTNTYNQDYVYRFCVTSTVLVTSSKVDLVNTLIKRQGELMKQGISISTDSYNNPTIYEFTGLNSIKPEMIAEATKNAREAAQKFAEDSGSKLGAITNATQGQFSIEDRDPYTPYIKTVRVVTYVDYSLED